MPRKNDKRKGRRQTRSVASISATRRNATSSASAATSSPTAGARITQNSRGNRSAASGRRSNNRRAPPPRKQNAKRGRGKKENSQLQDLNCYRADNGEVYKPGGNTSRL